MSLTRIAFDVRAPFIVACSDLPVGLRHYTRGEPFDWRALGIDEKTLGELWLARKVDVAPGLAVTAPQSSVTLARDEALGVLGRGASPRPPQHHKQRR